MVHGGGGGLGGWLGGGGAYIETWVSASKNQRPERFKTGNLKPKCITTNCR